MSEKKSLKNLGSANASDKSITKKSWTVLKKKECVAWNACNNREKENLTDRKIFKLNESRSEFKTSNVNARSNLKARKTYKGKQKLILKINSLGGHLKKSKFLSRKNLTNKRSSSGFYLKKKKMTEKD